jgi:hypothetical protein
MVRDEVPMFVTMGCWASIGIMRQTGKTSMGGATCSVHVWCVRCVWHGEVSVKADMSM